MFDKTIAYTFQSTSIFCHQWWHKIAEQAVQKQRWRENESNEIKNSFSCNSNQKCKPSSYSSSSQRKHARKQSRSLLLGKADRGCNKIATCNLEGLPRTINRTSLNVIYFCRLVNKNQTWKEHLSLEPRGTSEMSERLGKKWNFCFLNLQWSEVGECCVVYL